MGDEKNPFEGADSDEAVETVKKSKQDLLLEQAEKNAAEDLRKRKEGSVSKSSETKRARAKKDPKPKAAKAPKEKKEAKAKTAKKPAKAKKQKAAKPKAAAAPKKLGLNKAGEPRLKSEFDPETTKGQRGEKLKADEIELNDNESSVLSAVRRAGKIVLSELAERAFPKNKKANSWTRNALRRLIRARLVKKVGRGEYEKVAA